MHDINIEMFPASYGDSFLISCSNEINILVDTGFKSTYEKYIRDRLLYLKESGEYLKLLVITHIDADHLLGALSLLKENEQNSKVIAIDTIWHNSFRHLQWEKNFSLEELGVREKKLTEEIVAQGYPTEVVNRLENKEKSISAEQGSSLASFILQGGYSWNTNFARQAICVENKRDIHLNDDVMLTLLSPRLNQLKELQKYWERELYKSGFRKKINDDTFFDDAFEFLVSREKTQTIVNLEKNISSSSMDLEELLSIPFKEDTSVTNGSSIAFILHFKDKKILFLGDSHPSIIEEELKFVYKADKIWFDAVKISHHGSCGNTSPSLLNLIDSNNFFVSTNGAKHHHPDLVTLARIVCRESKVTRNLIFNYNTPASDYMNNKDRKKKYNYEVKIVSEGQKMKI
ncbi:AVAST type 1 anti-phage system MBL fold metallo-hydrolase Avs1a [Paenibacillus campi]|uniref:AVAST type 1 anti-phage system MBL fold metallo-hydrolase Avs1a n=1 Tax=Paenibacillus campi TaxID=3106031 RepID=UPI002AFE8A24|nr:AVAST type 1 anti-phage system MBL fold metallo-hydrolase Avs1a [Paenibacillus sp. SGZ-1014]